MIDTKPVLNRYADLSLRDRVHLLLRLKTCPWERILENFPRAESIMDLGCGQGLFINLLDLRGYGYKKFIGIDLDEKKIRVAQGMKNDHVSFFTGNIFDFKDRAPVITIFDMLYLLPFLRQRELITRAYNLLPPEGYLVIKEIDKKPLWKFLFNILQESISVKLLRVTLGNGFYFNSEAELRKILEDTGFKVVIKYLHKGYFHPHILYLCQKPH